MRRSLLASILALGLAPAAQAQGSHLLVVCGLGGDADHTRRFHDWASRLVDAARQRYGLPEEAIVYLAEDPDLDPARITGRSTRQNVEKAVVDLAARARPGDRVFIVFIGHGSFDAGESRFNLPGPDLTATDVAKALERLAAQTIVFVNTASASGGFVEALSGPARAIVTATSSGGERNETRFGEFFVGALAGDEADLDKDGRVSVLEAFDFARRQVAQVYDRDGLLLTEHALLDDNGDGRGSREPDAVAADGALARTLFMVTGTAALPAEAVDAPALQALYEERRQLEARLGALRVMKDRMDRAQYERELEALLVEIARKSRAIREFEDKTP